MHHYLPQQLGVAGHKLRVLLLQLVVPLLRCLGPFCTVGVRDDSGQCSRSRSSSSKWEVGRDAGVGGLTLCLQEGALQALVLQAAVPRGLQFHAKLFVLHQGPLLLRTLFLELRLQAVDLGLELGDVVLSLNGTYETEVMFAGYFFVICTFQFSFLFPVSMLATKNKSHGCQLF